MNKSTKITFYIIAIIWFLLSSNQKNWSRNQIKSDVVSYYSYLPALFIDHNITLHYVENSNQNLKGKYWALTTKNGNHIIKTSMGMSLLYLPSFLIAHYIIAPIGGYERNGYTEAYQACLAVGAFIYLFFGIFFLRKTLLTFYSETIALWVIISIFFATNLLWYSYGEALMPHQFIFALVSFMTYLTIKWHENQTLKYSVLLGITCGIIILVRPVDALICLFPLLYGDIKKNYLRDKIKLLHANWFKIIIICFIVLMIQIPQLVYWKILTGNWFYNSYVGEHFFWNHPHIIEGLWGYKKGWLIYTPIMIFSIAGILILKNKASKFILAFLIILPLFTYILFCWWSWWYGGSFGMRPFIDMYALLAIPMGASYTYLMNNLFLKITTISVIIFCSVLNLFQTYQFNNFILHYDAMTKKSYWSIFGKLEKPKDWWEKLRFTDNARAQKGLLEEYTEEEIFSGKYFFRTAENKLLVIDSLENIISAEDYNIDAHDYFLVIKTAEKKVKLMASNQKYISLNAQNNLVATSTSIDNATIFDFNFLGENQIELSNNSYKKLFSIYMAQ